MIITLEISTKNYINDRLSVKMALSHMETLVGIINGYSLSEPYEKFGWTFFKIAFKPDLQDAIGKKFADMLEKYVSKDPTQKFIDFVTDYFKSKNFEIKIKLVNP
jgi:hypothetical protein